MKSYCVKCKIYTKNINPRFSNSSNGKQWYHQNVQNAAVKNQDLSKNKKQKDY